MRARERARERARDTGIGERRGRGRARGDRDIGGKKGTGTSGEHGDTGTEREGRGGKGRHQETL